jgi:hypothetical protein
MPDPGKVSNARSGEGVQCPIRGRCPMPDPGKVSTVGHVSKGYAGRVQGL